MNSMKEFFKRVDSLIGGTNLWGVYVDSDDSYFGGNLSVDGNILLKSPDGTQWNCGVDNSGVFNCN